jgi:hypothetical protein
MSYTGSYHCIHHEAYNRHCLQDVKALMSYPGSCRLTINTISFNIWIGTTISLCIHFMHFLQTVKDKGHCHVCISLCTGVIDLGNVSVNGDTGWPNWLKHRTDVGNVLNFSLFFYHFTSSWPKIQHTETKLKTQILPYFELQLCTYVI